MKDSKYIVHLRHMGRTSLSTINKLDGVNSLEKTSLPRAYGPRKECFSKLFNTIELFIPYIFHLHLHMMCISRS
jgi:hypothetical protein